MANSNITKAFEEMNEEDIYSFVLQILAELKNDPTYGVLSELLFVMCSDCFVNLINLCGGTTIHIPTKTEVVDVIDALRIFINNKKYPKLTKNDTIKALEMTEKRYNELIPILNIITKEAK